MLHIDPAIPWLSEESPCFPSADIALSEPNGLLAAGGNLKPETLINAYQNGIFPWFNEGEPPLWWSPDPRLILDPTELSVSRSLSQDDPCQTLDSIIKSRVRKRYCCLYAIKDCPSGYLDHVGNVPGVFTPASFRPRALR